MSLSLHSPLSASDSSLIGISDQTRDISELVQSGDMMTQDGVEGVRSGFVPNTGAGADSQDSISGRTLLPSLRLFFQRDQ